jgi:hypothetical protein
MTDADYPAAHSMDTLWYAVDDAGHVAALWTGEYGPCPVGVAHRGMLDDLYRRTLRGNTEPYPGWDRSAQTLGVFLYRYIDDTRPYGPIDVYRRDVTTPNPLHVDQLPPDLRMEWKRLRFPGIRFAQADTLQPFEAFECHASDVDAEAYIASDGVTVRPIPGREVAWVEFVADFQERDPDQAARYRFEGPTDGR